MKIVKAVNNIKIFAVMSFLGGKFHLKIEKSFKKTIFLEECHKCKKHALWNIQIM